MKITSKTTKKELLEHIGAMEETIDMKDHDLVRLQRDRVEQSNIIDELQDRISKDMRNEVRAVEIIRETMNRIQWAVFEKGKGKPVDLGYMELAMKLNLAISILQDDSAFEYADKVIADVKKVENAKGKKSEDLEGERQ